MRSSSSIRARTTWSTCFKALDFDYVAVNPGSAFEGIHESLINHGGNRKPEILTVLHEEAGAAIAHGYAKAAGKPMMTLMHGTVGLLHASMGLFQAWCDRVPVFAVVGHTRNPTSVVNRPHSAQDMGAIVRDFMKMDDEPTNLDVFANIAMRAYTIGRTPPMGPTLLVVDSELQEAADSRSEQAHRAALVDAEHSARRCRRRSRSRASACDGGTAVDSHRQARAHVGRLGPTHRARRAAASARRRRRLRVVAGLPVVARVVRLRRPRLPARRDPRPRAQRHDGVGARRSRHGRQNDQHLLRVPLAGPQHPRLRQLLRGRRRRSPPTAKRRCRR